MDTRPATTYQRHRYPAPNYGAGPSINAGSFQRPYPYHLDYYKQRFGGSYAPYFGNLYGPPNVVVAPFAGLGAGGPVLQQPVPNTLPAAVPLQITCPHCNQQFQLGIQDSRSRNDQ